MNHSLHKKTGISLFAAALLLLTACAARDVQPSEPDLPKETEAAGEPVVYNKSLEISEVMLHNKAALMDEASHFHPWIELHNTSDADAELNGWSLTAGGDSCALPAVVLAPGEYKVLFLTGSSPCDEQDSAALSLKAENTLTLTAPDGEAVCSLVCGDTAPDTSLVRDEDGNVTCSAYPTPGYPNTDGGYCAWQSGRAVPTPVAINEVSPASALYEDYVEIKNTSDSDVNLSDYYLSDSSGKLYRSRLPDMLLSPGEIAVFYCDDILDFSLDPEEEAIYLSNGSGCVDYLPLANIPAGGSAGRIDAEAGVFLFSSPSPDRENPEGARQVSAPPEVSIQPGIYEEIQELTVEILSPSIVYYTTDCSPLSTDCSVYSQPLTLTETTVVRAFAREEGKLPSPAVTFSYIINEGLSLPVISLVTDSGSFRDLSKTYEVSGNLSFFEDSGSFSANCGITLSGNKSLNYPKKSLNIKFRSCYGPSSVSYDLFGGEVKEFHSLNIRAGQDYVYSFIKNELWQDVCLEATDNVLSQHSRYCAMFFNGEFFGIYALKENMSASLYASVKGIDKDDVEVEKLPSLRGSSFYEEVVLYCQKNDLSDDECYTHLSALIDMDSFADYYVVMGFTGNNDLYSNVRLYRSEKNGLKWSLAFYDLDLASRDPIHAYTNLTSHYDFDGNPTMELMYRKLLQNSDFRQLVIERFSALYGNVLSNENLISKIEAYRAILMPDMQRDHDRWYLETAVWNRCLNNLEELFTKDDWQGRALDNFCQILNISAEERALYFP